MTGLHMPDSYYQWLQDKYTHKRNLFLKGLEDIGIPHTEPAGRVLHPARYLRVRL